MGINCFATVHLSHFDMEPAVTTAAVTIAIVTTTAPAATCTTLYWPTIPMDLYDVPLILDKENWTFITYLACQQ